MPILVAVAAPLAHVDVVVNGGGTVEPAGGDYEVGTRLTFNATPGGGYAFGDWTDAAGALLSPDANGPVLEYTVVGDAQIVAHFAPSPFTGAVGNWTTWLRTFDFDPNGQPRTTARGHAAITMSGTGAFTGKVRFDAETFVLMGKFDAAGRAALSFPRTGRKPLRVVLRVKIEQPQDQLRLAVYDGGVCAMASVTTREAPGLGASYTVSLGMAGSDTRKGYASLKRTTNGAFKGIGSLDDGTAFCFATRAGVDHFVGGTVVPVDALIGTGRFLSGLIVLQDAAIPVTAFTAKLQLITPAPAGAGPPAGPPVSSVFVGPLGSDTNAGTADSPLATLNEALVRIGGEGEILMLPGNYEHASLNLATAGKVTLQAAPGHTASIFFGEKIMGADFTHHQGNVWKANVQSSVPVQGSENRFWIFEVGTPEGTIANGTELPQQRLRTTRLDHFRLVQALSIEDVDGANGRYFISGNTLYLRTTDGESPRPDQEFRIPSQATGDSVVFGAGPQCEITLRGIEVYFAWNGADTGNAAMYLASGCKFFGSGNSGIFAEHVAVGIEERCEYAANANDGCSPVNGGSSQSLITVIDPWSHDNGDEGHSLHGLCRGFYFAGLYEFNANGGLTPAIGANAVIQGVLTRGNLAGINPAVLPPVNLLVSDWISIGDFDCLANWTSGLATVVDCVLNPIRYSFAGIVADARIAVFHTIHEGGEGPSGGAGGPNVTFSDAPLELQRRDSLQAVPVTAVGSRFEVPGTGLRVAPFGNGSPNGHIVVRSADAQGASVIELAESFTLNTANQITVIGPNPQQLAIELDAQTGWFSGQFRDSVEPTVMRNFAGVILQSEHVGIGLSPGAVGSAEVTVSISYAVGNGTPIVPTFTLNKPNPAASARFGCAVAISGSRMVVGACQQDTGATGAGSAYVYDFTSATPTSPVAMLSNPSPAAGGKFGISVAILGTRMVVGAPVEGAGAIGGGKAYVYDLSGASPTLLATLDNPNPSANGSFGSAVAISGIWMLVGAPIDETGALGGGRAYLYAILGPSPTLLATLNNPSPAANDRFGSAIAMSGTRAVIGAFLDDTGATDAGSVYVYNLIGATPGAPFATLNNPSPAEYDQFGFSVAVSGSRVVVGTTGDDTGATDAGSAYVYVVGGNTSTVPVLTLNKPNPTASDRFGSSVAIFGVRVVVGAGRDDTGATDAGSAYIYDLNSGTPSVPSMTLKNPNPAFFDQFASSVAVDGITVAVGMPFDNTVASDKGAAYVFTLPISINVPAGTNATTDGGTYADIVIEDGGTLTVDEPPTTGTGAIGVPTIRLAGIGNARHLIVEFVRSKSAGLIYEVEFGDLPEGASFQLAVNAPIITPIDADLEHIVVEDNVTVGDRPLRLGRVRVTSP